MGGVRPLSCATCGPSLEPFCSSVAAVASPGTWTQSTCAPLSTPCFLGVLSCTSPSTYLFFPFSRMSSGC
eukprot:7499738-Pyramimonas_sp.AAC.1